MRLRGVALFACLAVCSVSAVQAQYGLYGSPDVLPVGQAAAPAPPQCPYPAQAAAQIAYQPHQTGALYQYPTPAAQPVAWAGPAEQPPVLMQPTPTPGPAPVGPSTYPQGDIPHAPAPGEHLNAPSPQNNLPPPTFVPSQASPAAPQGSGMMNQMILDQGTSGGGNGGCSSGCGTTANCGQNGLCGQPNCCPCPWYASLTAMVVGRSDGHRLWTSYDSSDETVQLTNSQFGMQWKWGGEAVFGRRFCCDCVPYAIEARYWTAEPFNGSVYTSVAGGYVSTPLDTNSLWFGSHVPGNLAQNWFDGAQAHELTRHDEFQNIEINLVRQQLAWGCDSCWDIGWSLGVRYFRFQDYLEFGTEAQLATGWGDLSNTAYLSDRCTNNLVGPQFGFDAAYRVCNGLRVFISPKVGIFDNYLDSNFIATTGSGIVGSGPYGDFPIHSHRNGISFLTQIDVGADWQFTRNWSARAGYRVVAVTGVGTADDQFPQYICDTPEIANVAHTSSLVLHGALLGVTYNF